MKGFGAPIAIGTGAEGVIGGGCGPVERLVATASKIIGADLGDHRARGLIHFG